MLGLVGPTLLQLLYMVATARALYPTEFGQLMVCVAVTSVLSFFAGIGADGVGLKATARSTDLAGHYLGQSTVLIALTAPPLIVIAVGIVDFIDRTNLPLWLPAAIGLSEIAFNRIAMACQRVFIAFSEQFRAALVGMLIPLGRLLSALIVVAVAPSQENTLATFALAYTLSTLATLVICIIYTVRRTGWPSFSLQGMNLTEGLSFALSWVNGSLQVECDKMLLSYFATPAAVGLYSLGSRLMDGCFAPLRAIRIALSARMMRAGAGGHSAMVRFVLRILPVSIAYGLFAWATIAFLAPLAPYVFGERYGELVRILPILGALPLLRGIADIGGEIFVCSDRVAVSTAIQISTSVLRIAIGIVLIRDAGIDGAVAAALSATVLAAIVFWSVAFLLNRRTPVPVS